MLFLAGCRYNYTKVQQNGGTSGASAIAYSGTSGPQPISLNMQPVSVRAGMSV